MILRRNTKNESVAVMDKFLKEQGYENDINEKRLHHEIYMSDARKVAPEKWKTVSDIRLEENSNLCGRSCRI